MEAQEGPLTESELRFLPLSPAGGRGAVAEGEEEASAVTRAVPFRQRRRALAGPHPHSPRRIKVCKLPWRPPNGTSGSERPLGPRPPASYL